MRYFLILGVVFLIIQSQLLHVLCLKKKVIVIGSGISGLAATSSLIHRRAVGYNDVIVLEARGRTGGRIQTIPFGSNHKAFLEYGAQWIHGSVNNLVYGICRALNLVDEDTKTNFGDMYYASQDGTEIPETTVEKFLARIDGLFYAAEYEAETLTPATDKSLKSILDRKFDELLARLQLSTTDTQIIRAIYDARLKDEKVETGAGDLNQLSALGWSSFSDSGGDNEINLKDGYKSLIDFYSKQVTNQDTVKNIMLNEIVYQIQYPSTPASPLNPVLVYTINPLTGTQSIHEADYVLTTFPLGYLKANYKSLFNPPLPTPKVNAIEKLGFGVVNKYWLVFASQPFEDNEQGFQIFWRNDLTFQPNSLLSKCGLGNFPFYKAVTSFEALPKMKNVLYTFMTGDDAVFTEQLSDDCLLEVFYEMLAKVFPNIPKPLLLRRTKWQNEAYSKGSYSFIKIGSSITDVKNLAEPLNSRVFFAGEATSEKYYSTVHGAYESGLREAEKISKLILG